MRKNGEIFLQDLIDIKKPTDVLSEVRKIYAYHYDKKYFSIIESVFKDIKRLFEGKFPGYKSCNTKYHDFKHTLDAFIAVIRLVDGYNLKNEKLSLFNVNNLLLASLFHDTGYIQEDWDRDGTGAKYTVNHIQRSISFLISNHKYFGIDNENVMIISKFIRCTGLNINLETLSFKDAEERTVGFILGSADILGQMSDREYLEKLLFLYFEFKEAGVSGYNTEFDIIKKTLDFYEVAKRRLLITFENICDYTVYHFEERYKKNENLYLDAIDKNILYIEKIMADNTTNFRKKLRRGNILNIIDKLFNKNN